MMTPESRQVLDTLGITRPVYGFIVEGPGKTKRAWEGTQEPDIGSSKRGGIGIFFAPNEMGETRNEKQHLRHEANVIRFTSVFVDLDQGTDTEQRTRLNAFPLEPSILVKTGRGLHAYWLLDRFENVEPGDWRTVQSSLIELTGADPACTDPARLMRLPGSWHVKGEPKRIELLSCKPDYIYTLDEVRKELGDKVIHSPPLPRKPLKTPVFGRKRKIRVTPLGVGDRHAALIKEGARLFNGAAPSEIDELRAILKAWYAQSCVPLKPEWESEVDDFVNDWLIKKELKSFKV